LIHANGSGGEEAARQLSNAVQDYMLSIGPALKDCRVIVRVYADLKALSLSAAKAKLIDGNSQTCVLRPFASRFSKAEAFYDFIDVGDREVVRMKVEGMLSAKYLAMYMC